MNELAKSTPPLILILAQSMRTKERAEAEAKTLRIINDQPKDISKEENEEIFASCSKHIDQMLVDVPSSMQSLIDEHDCKPIEHINLRRVRRR